MTQRASKQGSPADVGEPTEPMEAGNEPPIQDRFGVSADKANPVITRVVRLVSVRSGEALETLGRTAQRELSGPDIFCWIPVFMALGILGYFSMAQEPSSVALGLLFALLAWSTWKLQRTDYPFKAVLALTCVVAGVGLSKWQTERVSTPLLTQAGSFQLSGRVADIVPGEKRSRLILRNVTDLSSKTVALDGVQLSAFNQHITDLQIGDDVWVRARLEPLSGPLIPNGYDFRRIGYFNGLSARGFLLGEAVPELNFDAVQGKSAAEWLTNIRKTISARLRSALPGEAGALASALLVGIRTGIPDSTEQALRNSGLAHILAISGLHMALVTALLFGTIRLAAAFARSVSATYEVKKWAAGAALIGALCYLGLSGAGISAQRAFLMAAVFLVAIMFNRAALTMRNVALAAIAILVFHPAAVLTPGFQMSFMAVIALVAVYRREGTYATFRRQAGRVGLVRSALIGTAGLALTSIVAGFATAPFAVHHFYQFAVYGLAGNLAAMPLVGFIVMPAGLLAMLMMPFGLEWLPLSFMKFGLDCVVAVAAEVSSWSGSVSIPGQQPALMALFLGLALICLCLMRTRLRFIAASLLLASAFTVNAGVENRAVLLIAQDGRMMAEITPEGLEFRGTARNAFAAGIWLRAFGDGRDPETVLKHDRTGQNCDRTGCLFRLDYGADEPLRVATISRVEALFEACQGDAKLIISALDRTPPCPATAKSEKIIIDRSYLTQRGSVVLSTSDDTLRTGIPVADKVAEALLNHGLVIETSLPIQKRPWN